MTGQSPAHGIFDGTRFLHPVLGFTLEFPKGWKTANAPTHVSAYHPAKEAQLSLGLADARI